MGAIILALQLQFFKWEENIKAGAPPAISGDRKERERKKKLSNCALALRLPLLAISPIPESCRDTFFPRSVSKWQLGEEEKKKIWQFVFFKSLCLSGCKCVYWLLFKIALKASRWKELFKIHYWKKKYTSTFWIKIENFRQFICKTNSISAGLYWILLINHEPNNLSSFFRQTQSCGVGQLPRLIFCFCT